MEEVVTFGNASILKLLEAYGTDIIVNDKLFCSSFTSSLDDFSGRSSPCEGLPT